MVSDDSGNGNLLVVGCPLYKAGAVVQGCIMLYDWNGTTWTKRAGVVEPTATTGTISFGASVAVNGDGTVIAVGCPTYNNTTYTSNGAIIILEWDGSEWDQTLITPANVSWTDRAAEGYTYYSCFAKARKILGDPVVLWEHLYQFCQCLRFERLFFLIQCKSF